jgi:hypothetical protein
MSKEAITEPSTSVPCDTTDSCMAMGLPTEAAVFKVAEAAFALFKSFAAGVGAGCENGATFGPSSHLVFSIS